MKFTDATIEHYKGKNVYLESDPDWIWLGKCEILVLDHKRTGIIRPININALKAINWCVVEEKIDTLSDKVKEISFRAGAGYSTYCEGCKIEDIQEFIDEITKNTDIIPSFDAFVERIRDCAGGRFK